MKPLKDAAGGAMNAVETGMIAGAENAGIGSADAR